MAALSMMQPGNLAKIETIQNQALRICLGAFRTSPIDSLHVEANETPIYLRRKKLALQYALKIKSTPENPVYEIIFKPNYEDHYLRKPNMIPSFGVRIKQDFNEICDNTNEIAPSKLPEIPPWLFSTPEIDFSLANIKKGSSDSVFLLGKFRELKDHFKQHVNIYTDGSKDANGVGAAVFMGGDSHKIALPKKASIFTAELTAIKTALDLIDQLPITHRFIIFSDSKSALEAIQNRTFNNPIVIEILEQLFNLAMLGHEVVMAWVPSHVGIPGNERADKAAKEAVNEPILNPKIPYTDLKTQIHRHIRNSWQDVWNECENNKLHAIHPILGEWSQANREQRREEVVLARARIGHTYLTHSFLLKSEDVPYCAACACNLTVKHLLIECDDYSHIRRRHYNVRDLKQLFEEINPNAILQFIKETGLYHRF